MLDLLFGKVEVTRFLSQARSFHQTNSPTSFHHSNHLEILPLPPASARVAQQVRLTSLVVLLHRSVPFLVFLPGFRFLPAGFENRGH